jgi:hypothetical protein
MKKIFLILCFCILGGVALWAEMPVPPPWIYGQWQTVTKSENGDQELLMLIFLPGDILINGTSIKEMILDGYIAGFEQLISNGIYTIHLEYADGFWWEESFPMPVMTSVYIDKSFEEGSYSVMTYQFLPLGMAPSYNVPNDFE